MVLCPVALDTKALRDEEYIIYGHFIIFATFCCELKTVLKMNLVSKRLSFCEKKHFEEKINNYLVTVNTFLFL